ncbi:MULTISPECIES: CoA pyrophosphatase [Pantoea]|jgi:8-oxo-dGTP pyrophosphatase MutT (NUDIX family)|uniref:CoA pyrophosphatase n=1 Tax=Pantoea brenneri TaxID=472694 RepID=A0A653SK78_9GAMM|nr:MULTISPECIES: CoA pyrophosphatase [Pantoea]KKD33071.1 NUDIX hydrolase [Pantoea sp. 3.5.1]MBS6034129.1 CoA pyrophosphatase [Pantoea sp.]MBZ6395141.1 CoA pyrophosphatase [Pantoea sp.]MBZ6438230.1 CoA pyrophosphatase [Pantoea sp.]MDH2122054.1 CoA pyrophosphatase [Pantoea brenneri]
MALTLDAFRSRFLLQPPQHNTQRLAGRHAAVLVPIVARPEPGLLLTQRSHALRKHAGQVAFPGGMQDDTDASLIVTALREAQEEVGIDPQQVEVLGVLPAVTSSTGFQVTPVLAIIPPDLPLRINPDEVRSAFEMPLAEALRLSRYSALEVHRAGVRHPVWLSRYQDYLVWGMTAGIIRSLSEQIAF